MKALSSRLGERSHLKVPPKTDDRFPRLHYGLRAWVVAKAPGRVLLGGLGVLGVGEMWVKEDPHHKDYPGYAEAPDLTPTDPPPDEL